MAVKKKDICVLIVEDDKDVLELLTKIVERRVIKTITAANGKEGLEKFIEHNPDIVITDVKMPVMTGFKMAEEILKINKDACIIAVSGYSDSEILFEAINIGINNYILKPVNKNKMIEILDKNAKAVIFEKEKKEADDKLRKMNLAKEKLMQIVGHDLRSPVASILSMMTLIIDENIEEVNEYKTIIEEMRKSIFVVHALLENLFDWTTNEIGNLSITPEEIDVSLIIEECILLIKKNAEKKEIKIIKDFNENKIIFADKKVVFTVFRNLISNAVKFTGQGGEIKIILNSLENKIECIVEDNGVGIPAEAIEKIFSFGDNVTTPGTDGEKGTGIGLALCRDFMDKSGGKLCVESTEGKGTKFSFTFPKGV